MSDPVEESIEFLRNNIKQSQAALEQLEAIPKAVRMVRHPSRNGKRPVKGRIVRASAKPIDEAKIIEAVKTAGPEGIGAGAIRAFLDDDVPGAVLSVKLAKMTEAGILDRSGERRLTRYRLGSSKATGSSTSGDDSEAA